jgi:AcrR family transcriptional regulator
MAAESRSDLGNASRARLLNAVIGYAQDHGISDVSLREIARGVGSSHRMLIYHFGSKEGLLVAVVQAMEAAQLDALAGLAAEPDLEPAEAIRVMWKRLADPSLSPFERLFFEMYGQALQGRPGTVELLDGIVDSFVEPGTEYWRRRGLTPAKARAQARLGLAVIRGLLLDLLATKDRRGVDAALEAFIQMTRLVASNPAPSPAQPTIDR